MFLAFMFLTHCCLRVEKIYLNSLIADPRVRHLGNSIPQFSAIFSKDYNMSLLHKVVTCSFPVSSWVFTIEYVFLFVQTRVLLKVHGITIPLIHAINYRQERWFLTAILRSLCLVQVVLLVSLLSEKWQEIVKGNLSGQWLVEAERNSRRFYKKPKVNLVWIWGVCVFCDLTI